MRGAYGLILIMSIGVLLSVFELSALLVISVIEFLRATRERRRKSHKKEANK